LTSLPFSWRIIKAMAYPMVEADSNYGDKALVANTWRQYLKTRRAFAHHKSQYSWDRNLYLIFSRYVWFNDLHVVPPQMT
jgi:N-acetylglucosaminylphosphatidylinositol deacetylase